jgi:hypothetical protein
LKTHFFPKRAGRNLAIIITLSVFLSIPVVHVSCHRNENSVGGSSLIKPPSDGFHTDHPMERTLAKVNVFITQQGSTFHFNEDSAVDSGLDSLDIVIGLEIAALASDALSGNAISSDRLERYQDFFAVVEESIAEQYQSGKDSLGSISASPQVHCPPKYGFSTSDARAWLLQRGYHLVPRYATTANGYGRDYAKFIYTSHWPASSNPFWTYRNQATVSSDNHSITFQDVEPNPELFAYPFVIWPGAWWGPFTLAWHVAC